MRLEEYLNPNKSGGWKGWLVNANKDVIGFVKTNGEIVFSW
ncbi:hypothetical protein GCM10008986_16380 [Salinibacillus aidingensis]|uniref:Uncharacterized protein n=1 Tax=Salinibacillus aidingensis TaxID=237684 RepID=A0ABP3L127_9BACI